MVEAIGCWRLRFKEIAACGQKSTGLENWRQTRSFRSGLSRVPVGTTVRKFESGTTFPNRIDPMKLLVGFAYLHRLCGPLTLGP